MAIAMIAITALFGMLPAPWLNVYGILWCVFKWILSRQSVKAASLFCIIPYDGGDCHRNLYGDQPAKMKEFYKKAVRSLITVGYLTTMIFGLLFAYWGHNWAFHGLYITGLVLIFFAGILLIIALWPWNPDYYQQDADFARTKKGVDIERIAFFATASPQSFQRCSALSLVPSSATVSKPSWLKISSGCLKKPPCSMRSSGTCTSCWL